MSSGADRPAARRTVFCKAVPQERRDPGPSEALSCGTLGVRAWGPRGGVGGSKAGCGRPEDGGVWTAQTVKRPRQPPAHPQYANYWAPLTRKRHIMSHPAQPRHTNHWAPRTRKRHQREHRPQRPTERSDPTEHAKGRTGDCPGPREETATRRTVTQGGGSAGNGDGEATRHAFRTPSDGPSDGPQTVIVGLDRGLVGQNGSAVARGRSKVVVDVMLGVSTV